MKWYPTAVLSDVLDRLGQPWHMFPSSIIPNGSCIMAGRARTVQIERVFSPLSKTERLQYGDIYHALYFMEQLEKDDILLVAMDEFCSKYAFFGGLMTTVAKRVGLAGVVIDGLTRDVEETVNSETGEAELPIFARGNYGQDMFGRGAVKSVDEKVTIGHKERFIYVESGDYIFGDMDGVIAVPTEHAETVFVLADGVLRNEERVKKLISDGCSVDKIIKECGEF